MAWIIVSDDTKAEQNHKAANSNLSQKTDMKTFIKFASEPRGLPQFRNGRHFSESRRRPSWQTRRSSYPSKRSEYTHSLVAAPALVCACVDPLRCSPSLLFRNLTCHGFCHRSGNLKRIIAYVPSQGPGTFLKAPNTALQDFEDQNQYPVLCRFCLLPRKEDRSTNPGSLAS